MRHQHHEVLAGIALGDPPALSRRDRLHLLVCRHCAAELTELRAIVATGREGMPYELRPPRPSVLSQIQAELAGDAASGQALSEKGSGSPSVDRPPRGAGSRPIRRPAMLALAAVALAAVSVGGVIWYQQARNDDVVVVARATLEPLPRKSGQGTAELIRKDGVEQLSVTATAALVGNGFEELWLINTDGERMISLGVLPPSGHGSYPLPVISGGGLGGYSIVDISLEPLDGNAAHSRDSLLRGSLG